MLATATVHKDSLENVARSCSLVYRSNRIWPLVDNYPKGVGRGVLVSNNPLLPPSPFTVGVFERASSVYDLVWLDEKDSCLYAWIGKNGKYLKTAVVLEEVSRLQSRYGYEYSVSVDADETVTILIRSE
jgi:hypothetical protein